MRQGKKPIACHRFLDWVTQVMPFTELDSGETTGSGKRKGVVMICERWGVMHSILDILKYFTYSHKRWLNTLGKK